MNAIIIGNTGFSALLRDYLGDEGIVTEAFAADREYISSNTLGGLPVIPIDELPASFLPGKYRLFMGVGYKKLGEIRKGLYQKCKSYGYDFANFIHPTACIDKGVKIGEGNIIFENVVIQKNVELGDCNLLFSNSTLMHDGVIGSFITLGAGSVSNGAVHIGDCCFIGSNATLRDKIHIGDHTLIGAGVYAYKDSEAGTAVLPARAAYIPEGAYQSGNRL